MNSLISELTAVKRDLEEWKKNLPPYYDDIVVPVTGSDIFDNPGLFENYPYAERLDYVTGKEFTVYILMSGFIGHTMNMYRAAILRIDRHLLGNMYPTAGPSEAEIMYNRDSIHANL
jgi:hypothetical protein